MKVPCLLHGFALRCLDGNSKVGLLTRQMYGRAGLRACLEIGWVAQATGLCRPATRRTEREGHRQLMMTACSSGPPLPFRSAGRRPGRASGPHHPFFKHALNGSEPSKSAPVNASPAASSTLSMNLVAADVRRLTLFRGKEVRASLRRLLRFRAPMRVQIWRSRLPGTAREGEESRKPTVTCGRRISDYRMI